MLRHTPPIHVNNLSLSSTLRPVSERHFLYYRDWSRKGYFTSSETSLRESFPITTETSLRSQISLLARLVSLALFYIF